MLISCEGQYHSNRIFTSRAALGDLARKIGLHNHVLVNQPYVRQDILGEALEALIGAAYIDSGYNLDKAARILKTIGYNDATRRKELRAASVASNSNESRDEASDTAMLYSRFESQRRCVVRFSHFRSIYLDLAKLAAKPYGSSVVSQDNSTVVYDLFNALYRYWVDFREILDECAWFPELHDRYNRLFVQDFLRAETGPYGTIRLARVDRFVCNTIRFNENDPSQHDRHIVAEVRLKHGYKHLTSRRFPGFARGTLIEHLREDAKLSPRGAFLAACQIEDQVRDRLRQLYGLPDWYDLPENQGKILPPWRFPKISQEDLPTMNTFDDCRTAGQDYSSSQDKDTHAAQATMDLEEACESTMGSSASTHMRSEYSEDSKQIDSFAEGVKETRKPHLDAKMVTPTATVRSKSGHDRSLEWFEPSYQNGSFARGRKNPSTISSLPKDATTALLNALNISSSEWGKEEAKTQDSALPSVPSPGPDTDTTAQKSYIIKRSPLLAGRCLTRSVSDQEPTESVLRKGRPLRKYYNGVVWGRHSLDYVYIHGCSALQRATALTRRTGSVCGGQSLNYVYVHGCSALQRATVLERRTGIVWGRRSLNYVYMNGTSALQRGTLGRIRLHPVEDKKPLGYVYHRYGALRSGTFHAHRSKLR